MTTRITLLLTLMIFLKCGIPYKKQVILPPENFELNNNILKTNGYYYCEQTMTAYCQKELKGTGSVVVKDSKYEEATIKVLVLYNKGQAYHSGGFVLSAIDRNDMDDYLNHCDQLESKNNHNEARKYYEGLVESNYLDSKSGAPDRGVYRIQDDLIKVQIYHSGTRTLRLYQYEGKIINDSTIHIIKEIQYPYPPKVLNQNPHPPKIVNEIYHFKPFPIKPDSTSYILNHRKRFGR